MWYCFATLVCEATHVKGSLYIFGNAVIGSLIPWSLENVQLSKNVASAVVPELCCRAQTPGRDKSKSAHSAVRKLYSPTRSDCHGVSPGESSDFRKRSKSSRILSNLATQI